MPTLVLPPRYSPDSIALWRAATALDWTVERLGSWRVPDRLKGQDVVLYGEPLFASVVADQLGVALLEPPIDWLPALPEKYRRRAVRLATLSEARRIESPAFIKPADDKCFAACVFQAGTEIPAADLLPEATPVLVAEPVMWTLEVRCFVLDRTVQTWSPYLRHGALAEAPDGTWPCTDPESQEAMALAGEILADRTVNIPPALALDIGTIQGRGWAVVEANAAWGSGIYGCDPAAVLRLVRRSCIPRAQLESRDKAWLVDRLEGTGPNAR